MIHVSWGYSHALNILPNYICRFIICFMNDKNQNFNFGLTGKRVFSKVSTVNKQILLQKFKYWDLKLDSNFLTNFTKLSDDTLI